MYHKKNSGCYITAVTDSTFPGDAVNVVLHNLNPKTGKSNPNILLHVIHTTRALPGCVVTCVCTSDACRSVVYYSHQIRMLSHHGMGLLSFKCYKLLYNRQYIVSTQCIQSVYNCTRCRVRYVTCYVHE